MQDHNSLIHRLPRHLKLGELRVFIAVLEARSFRKAAAVLHLTQPAVTRAVASLEDMLGVRLFDRRSDGVEPTVHGLSFAPRAAAVFDELRRAAQDLALVSRGAQGSLRVGIVPMPAIPFLPIAVKRLRDDHPDVFVSIVEAREAELLDRLRKRDIEIAILRLAVVDPGEEMKFDAFYDERLCVVAAKDHPLAARKRVTWPELLQQEWVMQPADCTFYEHVLVTLDRLGLAMPRQRVEAYSIQIQFGMVLHAGLLCFGMRSQVEFAPDKAMLVRLPFEFATPVRPVGAASLRTHELSPLAQQLIGHIRALVHAAPTPPQVPERAAKALREAVVAR